MKTSSASAADLGLGGGGGEGFGRGQACWGGVITRGWRGGFMEGGW